MDKYEVVVLGAGPGGYVAAIRAAQLGKKTAIIERDSLGGTCLNRGCIPTKTYVHSAEIIREIESAGRRGIITSKPEIDMNAMVAMKDQVVKQLSSGVKGLLKGNGITIIQGTGVVNTDRTITVTSTENAVTIAYDSLIIATGSEAAIPPIPGIDDGVMTSTELLNVEEIPESLAIIGGGVIGCEFATAFNAFGTNVTIIEMLPNLISMTDQDLSLQLKKSFKKKKIKTLLNHSVDSLKKTDHGYVINATDLNNNEPARIEAEKVLVSVGRKPNLYGLENLNLEMTGKFIKVNEKAQTNVEGVYAIGDVTGKILLAHVASAMGMTAAENAAGLDSTYNLDVVPSCIYTIPEIGSVGLSEKEARSKYENVQVGKFPVAALGRALAMGESEGSYKLIMDGNTGQVLGAHFFGPHATDLIMEIAVVIQAGGDINLITDTIHAHPTLAEGILEVAHDAECRCIHMPPKKK